MAIERTAHRVCDRLVVIVAVDVRSEQPPKMNAPIANTSLPTAHSSQSRKSFDEKPIETSPSRSNPAA